MKNRRMARDFQVSEEEQELVRGCLNHDRRAQKRLYDKYKDAMYTLAYRITSDFDLAGDALQEAFLGVFNGMANFRGESTLGAWIKTIVVRQAYKRIRKEMHTLPLDNLADEPRVDWSERLDVEYLEQAIQDLPPGYRSVFVLVEIEGYRHREVADILGISPGTSKSQLFHAKKMLQKRLRHFLETV